MWREMSAGIYLLPLKITVAIATFSVTKTPALSVIDSYEIKRNEKEKIPIVLCPIPDHFLCLKTLVTFIPY